MVRQMVFVPSFASDNTIKDNTLLDWGFSVSQWYLSDNNVKQMVELIQVLLVKTHEYVENELLDWDFSVH